MKKVFNTYAAYYDLIYKDKNYEKEAKYILNLLHKYNIEFGDILELGCGTGKHASFFSNWGFKLHGIDCSESMIEIANSEFKNENAYFEVADVRTFRAAKSFDVVLSMFHVASYQSTNQDLKNMFLTASQHLISGGIFIFDFWYGPAVLHNLPTSRIKKMNNNEIEVVRYATPEMKCNENIVNVNYEIEVKNRIDGQVSFFSEKHSMRYLFLPELTGMLEELNIEVLNSFSWMSDNELSLNSWQGLIIAKKNKGI
jgi:SAM-dependent methyltransferase